MISKHYATVKDILDDKAKSPLPLQVIPNYMGINLCSVHGIGWKRQENGELTELSIKFTPAHPEDA